MNHSDRKSKTKKLILDTYLDIAEKEGMSKVTVCKLCQQADISRPTFYNYYDSLEELLNDILKDLYVRINAEAVQRIIFNIDEEFICDYVKAYKNHSYALKKLMNGKSPEFEYYFQRKLFQNIPKPKDYETDYTSYVAYELINAVQITLLKLVIFNPDISDDVILQLYKNTTNDFAAREYTRRTNIHPRQGKH